MRIAMIGHKKFLSRSGGVEVVVYELSTRLAQRGYQVTVYDRGREKGEMPFSYQGVEVRQAPTFRRQSLNAMVYSVTATLQALFRPYDVYHYHALGPSVMLLLPRLLGKTTVVTVHGLDWQRDKWNRFASAYLKLGEKIIARFAQEVIVLSQANQAYFQKNTDARPISSKMRWYRWSHAPAWKSVNALDWNVTAMSFSWPASCQKRACTTLSALSAAAILPKSWSSPGRYRRTAMAPR